MPAYVELAPPARLAETVECLWVMHHEEDSAARHRVLPDGCADILFTTGSAKPTLQVVGAMTRFEDYRVLPGQTMVGLRFHPGMWAHHIGIPADQVTDGLVALEDLWGPRARSLLQQLAESTSPERCAGLLAGCLRNASSPTALQRALAWMRLHRGVVSLDVLAGQCGISPRQFRRLCLEQAGLSPKLLARIVRFRYALSRIHDEIGQHAGLAADCGYFDQSHFIADFQRFSGHTPAAFSAR